MLTKYIGVAAGVAILLLLAALGTTGWMLKGAWQDNTKLETKHAVQAETIKGLQEKTELLMAFHAVLDKIGTLMDEKLSTNTDLQKQVLREIEDAALKDKPTQDLLEQRLTDALIRVLCDAGHFHPSIRAELCGRADPEPIPAELPARVPDGRDSRPPADVGY